MLMVAERQFDLDGVVARSDQHERAGPGGGALLGIAGGRRGDVDVGVGEVVGHRVGGGGRDEDEDEDEDEVGLGAPPGRVPGALAQIELPSQYQLR